MRPRRNFVDVLVCRRFGLSSRITSQNIDKPKRQQPKRWRTETSTNRIVDIPKLRQTKMLTDQNVDKPKRRQTKTSTNQNVDRPKHRQTKTSTNQNVDIPKFRQTKMLTDQNVDKPKRRQTETSTLHFSSGLSTFWFVDVLVYRRFGCRRFGLSTFWPVTSSKSRLILLQCDLVRQCDSDVIMSTMASQITSLTILYSTVYSGTDQRKHQSTASLAFVWGIHRWPVNSPHKGPVTWKMFPFDNVVIS